MVVHPSSLGNWILVTHPSPPGNWILVAHPSAVIIIWKIFWGVVFDVEWHHLLPQVFLLPAIDALMSAVKGSMKQRLTDFSNVR